MAHGAKVIWDFDDDNILNFWVPGAAPDKTEPIFKKLFPTGLLPPLILFMLQSFSGWTWLAGQHLT